MPVKRWSFVALVLVGSLVVACAQEALDDDDEPTRSSLAQPVMLCGVAGFVNEIDSS